MSDIRRRRQLPINISRKRIPKTSSAGTSSLSTAGIHKNDTQFTVPKYVNYSSLISRKRQKELGSLAPSLIVESSSINSTPEFILLCKLFVPRTSYLRITESRLMQKLPNLIYSTTGVSGSTSTSDSSKYTLANYQLHLLMATITSKYIDSWYSSKLNTDNFEFIEIIYKHLCHVVRQLVNRLRKRVFATVNSSMDFLNEFIEILNNHLEETLTRKWEDVTNDSVVYDDDYEDKIRSYLSRRNVIFSERKNRKGDDEVVELADQSFFDRQSNYEPSSEIVYLRVLSSKIVGLLFEEGERETEEENEEEVDEEEEEIDEEEEQGGDIQAMSPIGEGLLISILGDLVFVKVLESFSNPNFLLGIVNTVVDKFGDEGNENEAKKHGAKGAGLKSGAASIGFIGHLSNFSSAAYNIVESFLDNIQIYTNRNEAKSTKEQTMDENILNSSIFRLIDMVTQFSDRKPILTGFLKYFRSLILSNSYISCRVDLKLKSIIWDNTSMADDSLAEIIAKLRMSLFGEKDKDKDKEKEKEIGNSTDENSSTSEDLTVEALAAKISTVLTKKTPQSALTPGFTYLQDGQQNDILRLLGVFKENQDLNKLLIIQWVDLIMAKTFPELTE
ncbi:hypothetical protein CLIB1423_19S00562 [[Candida] railenensis]|uniref:PXA domain-containing protein n=1 Tax=[Candida] railenensis TaxID=45579 RepID=A0A9P0W0A6_9ASCO|nr:hypothetical protein CLIB1423_19S00562 [[Candida] railenensis]